MQNTLLQNVHTYETTHVGTSFTCMVTNETFWDNWDATCKSSNVVYLIECVKCKKHYVGETENPLHLRVNGHRSDYYRKLPDKPVEAQFNTLGHTFEDITIMVIEELGSALAERRKFKEKFRIHTLRSMAAQGLNLEDKHRSRLYAIYTIGGHGLHDHPKRHIIDAVLQLLNKEDPTVLWKLMKEKL